ncbi:MAG: ABC transporter ATP-binding protein [Pseudomonadota bacterium]|nr:ABC transporter ATP-binding protein [Pseudomonadota bacterium]
MNDQQSGAVLELRGIGKSYVSTRTSDSVEALTDVDFTLRQGEFFAVVGPSGCGKSTLLSIVAGFVVPSTGEVRFEGKPITGPAPERGVMFQDYALFPWQTVAGNIEFGPRARGVASAVRKARAQALTELVGLQGFENRYPHELSGGMRQRCALARMLANDPRMWLMDEPLAAVDLQTRIILQDELLRLWGDGEARAQRPTVVFVTHGIEEAVLLADRVLVLARRPGRIKAIIDIDLPRPRAPQRNGPGVARFSETLWSLIREDAAQAMTEQGR